MRSTFTKLSYWIIAAALASAGFYGILNDYLLGWIPLAVSGALLGGYMDWKNGGFFQDSGADKDVAYRAKAAGITEEELRANDARIDRDHEITVTLVEKFPLPSGRDEPLPPWIKFPGWSPYHIFWRMGDGESYIAKPFGPFMISLDKSEREKYFARYDLGEEWPHRPYWYLGWVEEDY